jgi:hypothetical protein
MEAGAAGVRSIQRPAKAASSRALSVSLAGFDDA